MNDLLKSLREHLTAMIEEIDNYTHADSDNIIIYKKDFKFIKYNGKLNSYIHVFEYKEDIKFTLRLSSSYPYELKIYKDITNGTLDFLILNKIKGYSDGSQVINYSLEPVINTKLRNLYSPLKQEDEEKID